MADLLVEPPQRKRKVEASRCSDDIAKGCETIEYDSSEDDDDFSHWTPAQREEYFRQVRESLGFDIGHFPSIPASGMIPCIVGPEGPCSEVALYARLGLHCFNIQKGTNLQLIRVSKYNSEISSICTYYITVEVKDLAKGSFHTFQTTVTQGAPRNNERLRAFSEVCRLKPEIPGPGDAAFFWDDEAIDDFYKGNLPNWLSDDALTGVDKLRFYEVQDTDYRENDWLRLYTEFALFYHWRFNQEGFKSALPVDIKKIVVETHDASEPHLKLKSNNAYFYISFRANNGSSPVDYRAVMRKTMDGKPGHISLQVLSWSD